MKVTGSLTSGAFAADEPLGEVVLLPKAIDNSQVVRQVDPRQSRRLWLLVLLVVALSAALVLYAWPSVQLRQSGIEAEQLLRERDRLREHNRKLRLEKAALEDLARVESIARRDLGLVTPAPEDVVVVEKPAPAPPAGTHLASGKPAGATGTN